MRGGVGNPKKCCSWCLFNVDCWGCTLPRLDWELSSAIFFSGFHRNPGPSSPADSLQLSVENHQNLMVYHHHKSGHFGALPHFQTYAFFFSESPLLMTNPHYNSYSWWEHSVISVLLVESWNTIVDWHPYDIPIYCWLDTNLVRCRTVFDHPAVFAKTLRPSTLVAAQRF